MRNWYLIEKHEIAYNTMISLKPFFLNSANLSAKGPNWFSQTPVNAPTIPTSNTLWKLKMKLKKKVLLYGGNLKSS